MINKNQKPSFDQSPSADPAHEVVDALRGVQDELARLAENLRLLEPGPYTSMSEWVKWRVEAAGLEGKTGAAREISELLAKNAERLIAQDNEDRVE